MNHQEVPNCFLHLACILGILYTSNREETEVSIHVLEGIRQMHYPRIRDYTSAATLILILYVLGWFPGLIFNLIKLFIATFEKDSYDIVHGFGCLVWLLVVCGFGPIALFGFAYFLLLHLY